MNGKMRITKHIHIIRISNKRWMRHLKKNVIGNIKVGKLRPKLQLFYVNLKLVSQLFSPWSLSSSSKTYHISNR